MHETEDKLNCNRRAGAGEVLNGFAPSPERLAACSTAKSRAVVKLDAAQSIGLLPLALVEHNGESVLAGAVGVGGIASAAQAIRFRFGLRAKLVEVDSHVLNEAITIAYKGDGLALVRALSDSHSSEGRCSPSEPSKILWMPENAGAARVFSELVEHGVAKGASDIFLTPGEERCTVSFKVNGELHRWSGKPIARAFHAQLVRRAKVLSRLDPTITAIPQDGSFEGVGGLRARVSTLPTIHGENVVVRLVSGRVRDIDSLGLDAVSRERLERWISTLGGLVMFGGPTGAGKSASLYAVLGELVRRGIAVTTIEDPVEQRIVGANQSEVPVGKSFSTMIRAVLRQAPDVIAVGEVRDAETALALIEAATTGHLVLCSIHAGGMSQLVGRFNHFGVTDTLLCSVWRGALVQRLLPRLCGHCKVVDLSCGGYREVGCAACGRSGYDGRVLVVESYEHRHASPALELNAPHLLSFEQHLSELIRFGVISTKTAALVRW